MQLKLRLFKILERSVGGDYISRITDIFLVVLILVNAAAVVLETVRGLYAEYRVIFAAIELFSGIVFSIEYILRLWVCTQEKRFKRTISGRLKYMLTPLALIDLAAVLAFYLPFVITDLQLLRLVRLVRLLRLLQVIRYSESLKTFTELYRMKRQELSMVFLAIGLLLVVSSAVIYHVEHEAQPEAFSSIPASMWWGVSTLTTVGYGDVYPSTPLGKFFGAIIALLGIGFFALPAGILGSGFVAIMRRKSRDPFVCPHCQREIKQDP